MTNPLTTYTCGSCGLSWDDSIPTQYTPAPGGRCPFEYFHAYNIDDEPIWLDPDDIPQTFPVQPLGRQRKVGTHNMPANMSHRFEGGAHLTFYDQETHLSFSYYADDDYVSVSHGGYGEPVILRLAVPATWLDSVTVTMADSIRTFQAFCIRHLPYGDTRSDDIPF